MASNTPDQSTPPAYSLGPPRSLGSGAPSFIPGECILVRIPEEIQVGGHVDNEATAVGTDLPPTSNGSSPQHFAFIRLADPLPGNACILEVYPVLPFSRTGGAVSTYNKLPDTAKATLLPLPPLSFRHPPPDAFGAPLDLGDWSNSRDSFLHVIPRRFVMPSHRPFKRIIPPLIMPFSELSRIDQYREYLYSTQTANANSQSPNDGSGNEQGSSNLRRAQTGDGGGPTSSPTIIGDGEGQKAAEAELGGFSFKTQGLLVLEGVDEDAEDADATFRDELIMLARDDPMWREELRKYLQDEEKERELIQKERAARLAHWREDMATQAT
ncbi:hypothetical protein AX14_004796 [Amanita brunnescens Koide BX004]|nr:hypothetical protein AX14_004796 [Amanita brunnescens Koide BX004]